MRKVLILIFGIALIMSLSCCGKSNKQDFHGRYTFEKVSYLSPLSSSTIDFVNSRMAGTKYIIETNLFKIESKDYNLEISSPNYMKQEVPENSLFDVHTLDDSKVDYQYTIFDKNGSKTNLRLYVSDDDLWISSYVDNTANGSEIIMNIFKLSNL